MQGRLSTLRKTPEWIAPFPRCPNCKRTYKAADTLGDAYTYFAMGRNSKLILAWHLGKRNKQDTLAFIIKLHRATEGKFQLTTDGWLSYREAVQPVFGSDIDYAQLVKVYAASSDGEQR